MKIILENQFIEKYKEITRKFEYKPQIAIVLGSGLGGYVDKLHVIGEIGFLELENFPQSTAPGHAGKFVFGYLEDIPVVVLQGRLHCYEGYTSQQVVLPIYLLKRIDIKILILTNAAGGIHSALKPGDFMVLKDHISSFIPSPLIGSNDETLGERFPDMSEVYNKELRSLLHEATKQIGLSVSEGVYIQLRGPNFETAAEINMCRILGADAVGMSTVCEALYRYESVWNFLYFQLCMWNLR